ncbi:MAG: DUF456 domain-containing protein [Phycisphaerae bacterium]
MTSCILGLPGNWLMVMFTWILAWWQWDKQIFTLPTLIVITALALFGELAEFLSGVLAVRKAGGTKRGTTGAVFGAILFAICGTFIIPIPIIGSVAGACFGAFIGALALEFTGGRTMRDSVHSGLGAGIGQFLGMNLKLLLGLVIWLITAIAAFWP